MAESSNLSTETARHFAEFIRSPEASEILRQALHEAIADGVIEQAISHSDEAAGTIQRLAARSGDNPEDVQLKALRLYELALDAIEKGNYLAILTSEDEIVREITGFEPVSAASRPVGR